MPYSETHEESFSYFEEWEEKAIEDWLKERGYTWGFPTLCGSCCGYWNQEYWVQFKPGDIAAFNAFARDGGLGAIARSDGIHIGEPEMESD